MADESFWDLMVEEHIEEDPHHYSLLDDYDDQQSDERDPTIFIYRCDEQFEYRVETITRGELLEPGERSFVELSHLLDSLENVIDSGRIEAGGHEIRLGGDYDICFDSTDYQPTDDLDTSNVRDLTDEQKMEVCRLLTDKVDAFYNKNIYRAHEASNQLLDN